MKKDIIIIMGSISDWKTMKNSKEILNIFKTTYDIDIISAHRTPEYMYEFAKSLDSKYKIVIAGAGGSAHLPGMVASLTTLPVIGVPINSKLNGIDSLYSIIQMPSGTPVATVGIDNIKNACLLAIKILAINNENLKKQLIDFKKNQILEVNKSKKHLK